MEKIAGRQSDGANHEDQLAKAKLRLRTNKTPATTAAIKQFEEDLGLSKEVLLTLRMLSPDMVSELEAGKEDIKERITEVSDKREFMLALIAQMDPEAHDLVLEVLRPPGRGSANKEPAGGAPGETTAAAGRTVEGGQETDEVPIASLSDEELLATAKERLRAYKTPASDTAIGRLTRDHGFNEEVQVALRMLSPPMVREMMAGEKELVQRLNEVDDKQTFMLKLISKLDPDVHELVKRILYLDGKSGTEEPVKQRTTPRPRPQAPAGKNARPARAVENRGETRASEGPKVVAPPVRRTFDAFGSAGRSATANVARSRSPRAARVVAPPRTVARVTAPGRQQPVRPPPPPAARGAGTVGTGLRREDLAGIRDRIRSRAVV